MCTINHILIIIYNYIHLFLITYKIKLIILIHTINHMTQVIRDRCKLGSMGQLLRQHFFFLYVFDKKIFYFHKK